MNSLAKTIKEFHRLYAEYRRPEYLEIAANLGKATPDRLEDIWTRLVNEGCDRNGLARIYP